MTRRTKVLLYGTAAVAVAVRVVWAQAGSPRAEESAAERAAAIVSAAGVQGGLIVHVGCGDGRLAVALGKAGGADGSFLVHGLARGAATAAAARRLVRASRLYGRVSIDTFDGRHLPYADNLVNLLIVEGAGADVPTAELRRVLCPAGVAMLAGEQWQERLGERPQPEPRRPPGAGPPSATVVRVAGRKWTRLVKPWPRGQIDDWSHFLHGPDNNAVAADRAVGPPRRLRWLSGPRWSRSHEFISSLCAMVSARGRVFYIADLGLTSLTDPPIPERWTLIARDAFNGVLLWQRSLPRWGAGAWGKSGLRRAPAGVARLLVASRDRLFVPLAYGGPVSALDPATGRVLATYPQTAGAQEMRYVAGRLVVRTGTGRLVVVEAASGRLAWETGQRLQPLSLAAQQQRVFYKSGKYLVCRRLADGEQLWRVSCGPATSVLVATGPPVAGVLVLGGGTLRALGADDGRQRWSAKVAARRRELFVANGRVWHWQGERLVGRDLHTGRITDRLDTADVFTPGHHLRCYPSKATERFLITPNRGAEFVSLTGQANTQNDWLRGACRYGVMPANGLLYVPPHPCLCNPGVMLAGFYALAPARESRVEGRESKGTVPNSATRLERGPAYAATASKGSASHLGHAGDWPTYRHDAARSGSTEVPVAADLERRWAIKLGGRLSAPTIAGGRVYVAAIDEHTIYAFDAATGKRLWHFTAGGRIDSPPSVCGGLVLFGCTDGWLYCLKGARGELAWRFRAAPDDRRIIAHDQLESPWPVHGSVLVQGGLVYCTAGRSSFLDGGIRLYALDPATGKLLHHTCLNTWARTRQDAEGKPFIPAYYMEGARSDILVAEGGFVYLGQYKFDRRLQPQPVPYVMTGPDEKTVAMDLTGRPFVAPDAEPDHDYERHQRDWLERNATELLRRLRQAHGGYSLGQRQMGLHVLTTSGFLDDSWFNRTFWMYSATWPGYYLAHRAAKTGQLLVVGPERTYAVQAYPSRNLQSPLFTPGKRGYLLVADANDNEPVLDYRTRGTTKGWGYTRLRPPDWFQWVPIRIRAMVLAGGHLFVSGPPDVLDPQDPMAAFEGRSGAVMRVYSAENGRLMGEQHLAAPPVFDGMAAASGRLFVTCTDGTLLCMQ